MPSLIGMVDYPSTGLGIEIGLAIGRHQTPVLLLAHTDSVVTRAVLDPDEPNVRFIRYADMIEDVPRLIAEFIESIPDLKKIHKGDIPSVPPLKMFRDSETGQPVFRKR